MPLKEIEAEVIDVELVAEQELSKLCRLYRIMEGDRMAYSGEASGKLKRQRNQIKILRKEQNNLLADLNIATHSSKTKQDTKTNDYLRALLKEYTCLEQHIKSEKAAVLELEFQIKKMEREVADIKTRSITDLQASQRIINGQRSVVMLENRLDTYMKRFNMTVAENAKLRAEIDHMLKERAHFNLLWDRLINCLNQGKKFMLDLIEQATLAYDQREEWCNKLAALRARGNQDLVMQTKEIRFLQRKLDHDAKLQEFLGIKGQKRILSDLEARLERKKQLARENMQKQLEEYRNTLRQIQEFSGESDIERLAAKFVKQEEENFALFNYVNELNHESESLSYAIDELKKNIDLQRDLNNQREKQQQDNITNLENKLKEETEKSEEAEKHLATFDKDLEFVYKEIERIFQLINCNRDPILMLLGSNEVIHQYNVLLYLGLIEKRVTQLVQQVYYKEKSALERRKRGQPIPNTIIKPDARTRYMQNSLLALVPTQPCPLCVETEQVSDVIDTLQFAQSHPDVEEKLRIRLGLPHALDRLHNVSNCHLPQSRKIIQQRYQ